MPNSIARAAWDDTGFWPGARAGLTRPGGTSDYPLFAQQRVLARFERQDAMNG